MTWFTLIALGMALSGMGIYGWTCGAGDYSARTATRVRWVRRGALAWAVVWAYAVVGTAPWLGGW